MQATAPIDVAGDRRAGSPRRGLLVPALLLLLWGCGGSNDPTKTIQSLDSWSASLRLARDARLRGSVNDAYARQLVDRAREQRQQAAQSLASESLSTAERGRAASALARLDGDARQLTSELGTR